MQPRAELTGSSGRAGSAKWDARWPRPRVAWAYAFELVTPTSDQLDALVADLSSWQQDGLPIQLYPGDVGWHWRFGSIPLAEALRVWTAADTTMAIGFLDETSLIRMAITPSAEHDEELAQAILRELEVPARGILEGRKLIVEGRFGTAFRSRLRAHGWGADDPWTPLVRDLSELADPVDARGLRVEIVGLDLVADCVTVLLAALTGRRSLRRPQPCETWAPPAQWWRPRPRTRGASRPTPPLVSGACRT